MENKNLEKPESVKQFTERLRKKQSNYRKYELGINEEGFGPTLHSKNRHPNMLINGEETGLNFIDEWTFEYAKKRISLKGQEGHKHDTIDAYRLFNNMLSSQPMAFNLFCPLMKMLQEGLTSAVTSMIAAVYPDIDIKEVTKVDVEYIRDNIENYLNDKTAMDAVIMYKDSNDKKCLIAIETKYSDVLGTNSASNTDKHIEVIKELKCFKEDTESQLISGEKNISQIYRNFLLTEKYGRDPNEPLNYYFSVILSPKDHPTTQKELSSLKDELKEEFKNKIRSESLEKFIAEIKSQCPDNYRSLFDKFEERYLGY